MYTLSEQANREVCAVWSSDGSGGVESITSGPGVALNLARSAQHTYSYHSQ